MSGRQKAPQDEAAHDVLAAEAYAMPAPDPYLRHRPITLPEDPTGIAEPHDVLAAEEFAMPATRPSHAATGFAGRPRSPSRVGALAAVALLALRALRRHRA